MIMGERTAIEWTSATVNAWIGCTNISPGCDRCYAERMARRLGVRWGADQQRLRTKRWRDTLAALDRKAKREKRRIKVFPNSMSDCFDGDVPEQWRLELLIAPEQFDSLDFQFLTKRVGNVARMVPEGWLHGRWPRNAWLGITVVNQTEAARDIPKLLKLPAPVRFLSCEPLLGRVDLCEPLGMWWNQTMKCFEATGARFNCGGADGRSGIDWVIAGGESGHGARPMHPDWARSLRDQCAAAGVPFFFKQWGEHLPADADECDPAIPPSLLVWSDGSAWSESDGQRGGVRLMARVGKKTAGRLLDGVEHNGFPA
jgi:protein gp37